MGKDNYEDFYVAFLDMAGNVIYPSDVEEAKTIRKLLKNKIGNGLVASEDGKRTYLFRFKRKEYEGKVVQVVELSNITKYIEQATNANVDEITHLNNRKIARNLFLEYIEKAHIKKEDFSIILGDLDDFKGINDTYGHINGDRALCETSRVLYCSTRQDYYREQDLVARIGGDEFFILLKNISEETAFARAERMRKDIEEYQIPLFNEEEEEVLTNVGTMSMGLYHVTSEEINDFYAQGYTTDEIRNVLLDRCDTALYESKNNGRNRVTIYSKEKMLRL